MENREKAFWQMQNKCLSYCLEHKNVWKNFPVIHTLIDLLEANHSQLITAIKAIDTNNEDKKESKDFQFNQFSEKIYRLSRKMSLYAKMTNNELLLNEVNLSENSIYTYAEDKLLRMYTNILNHANRHVNNLYDYMVESDEIDSLRLELTHLKHTFINKNQILNKRIATPRSVKELITEARKLLDRLDDAFEGLIGDAEFKSNWVKLRQLSISPIFKTKRKEKSRDNIDFNYYG